MNKSRDQLNRYTVMTVLLALLLFLLLAQTFRLMVVDGQKYREISDNKRIKDVYITAPRGNIYDRNGVLLAGTRPSFAVQLLLDDLKERSLAQKNQEFLDLVRILEEDGTQYVESMPVDMNVFAYQGESDYFSEESSPDEKALRIIVDNNLTGDFLRLYHTEGDEGIEFLLINRALTALDKRGQSIPIRVKLEDVVTGDYVESDTLNDFLKKHSLTGKEDPIQTIVDLVDEDKTILRSVLDHHLARKLAYGLLESRGLAENLVLKDYVITYDEQFLQNKADLHRSYPQITLESGAREDFIAIVSENSLRPILERIEIQEDSTLINPAGILLEMIEKETGRSAGISSEVDLEQETVHLHYTDENVETAELPMERLTRLAKEAGVIGKFAVDDRIKFIAQEVNTELGILPQISVLEWDYIFIKNKSDLIEYYDASEKAGAKELLDQMKKYYELEEMSDPEALSVISLHRRIEEQGHYSYQPITIAYGIKEETIARLKEQLGNNYGINISAEPIRYYPEGKSAAHLLGYIGRISQPDEIQRYVEDKGYGPNDLIGKTGVEESFESVLRGEVGKQVVEVDAMGNRTNLLKEILPTQGNSVYLSADIELQRKAESSLKHALEQLQVGGSFESEWGTAPLRINESEGRPHYHATSGSAVVLDVKTGEVLALANETSYDPNLFATGISNSDWKSLFPEDENNPLADRPLLNIAMQSQIQPGSIFKLATSLAALEKGFIPYREIECSGYVELGDTIFGCWIWNTVKGTHGLENLYDAIRDSCNYYYYALAMGENPQTGDGLEVQLDLADIRKTTILLGLDAPTGIEINIPYENGGRIPNPMEKKETIKALLQQFLEENLESYVKPSKNINPVIKEEMIRTITAWVEQDQTLEYQEIAEKLEEMQIDSELVLDGGRENLTDIIKYTYVDQGIWNISDMLNVVIGQGQNAYTPLQMANYMSIFANGGYRNKVTVIKEVKSFDDTKVLLKNEPIRHQIELNDPENLKHVGIGMNMAAYYGSLRDTFGTLPVEVAVKTGTAERSGVNPDTGEAFDDYSWMIAYAPYDDPQIAISVLLYQAGSGANCAPIVRELVAEYLKLDPATVEVVEPTEASEEEIIE